MKEQAILVDTTYCTGCNSCSYRCIQEFGEHDLAARGFFRTFVQIKDEGILRTQCMSCKDPQCVKASSGAFTKSAYGPVLVNAAQAKGGKDAVGACPFHALQYDEKTNQVINCNMCAHRLTAGQKPACVEACPSGALQSGDYEAMAAKAKQVAADKKLKIYGLKENGGTNVIILTKASYGAVLVNAAAVKNAKDAVDACPFHAIQYDEKTNKLVQCNMCAHRLTAGQKPACVEACPSGALQSGDYEAMAAKAKELAAAKKLKIYGLNENGGTHVIILTKADPVSLGYPKVAKKHLANLELPLAAGALYLGFKALGDRKEAVQKAEKEPTK